VGTVCMAWSRNPADLAVHSAMKDDRRAYSVKSHVDNVLATKMTLILFSAMRRKPRKGGRRELAILRD
jgi:hypothetical protein